MSVIGDDDIVLERNREYVLRCESEKGILLEFDSNTWTFYFLGEESLHELKIKINEKEK